MEEERQERESHAKARRRKDDAFAPLRLCVRVFCSASFVLCFALLIRCGTLWLTPNALQNDPDEYLHLATNLVEYRTLGSGTTPTAYRPPLYPIVLTGCAVAYDRALVVVAIMLLHVVLGVTTVGLVLLLGRWWGLGAGGAAVAALLVACDPILLDSSSRVMTETLATLLTTAGLLALTCAGRRRTTSPIAGSQRLPERASVGDNPPGAIGSRLFLRPMVAGIVLALAALCRPAFLLWTLAAGVVLLWQAFRNIKGDSPIFVNHGFAAVPAKIGTVPRSRGPTARGRIANHLRAPAAFALAR